MSTPPIPKPTPRAMPDPEGQATCKAEHALWGVTCDRPSGHAAAGWLHHHGVSIEHRRKPIPVGLGLDLERIDLDALVPETTHRVDVQWTGPEGITHHPAGVRL